MVSAHLLVFVIVIVVTVCLSHPALNMETCLPERTRKNARSFPGAYLTQRRDEGGVWLWHCEMLLRACSLCVLCRRKVCLFVCFLLFFYQEFMNDGRVVYIVKGPERMGQIGFDKRQLLVDF